MQSRICVCLLAKLQRITMIWVSKFCKCFSCWRFKDYMSHCMGKLTMCICENKAADQRLCFRHTDSTIPLPSKSKMSSLLPSSVTVQAGLCRTWSEPKLLVFSCIGSYDKEFIWICTSLFIQYMSFCM